MPHVVAVEPSGRARRLEAAAGSTILELARNHDLPLEGTCGGQMACATCHVVIDPAWFARLPRASAEEADMLALAARPRRTSRLGCQVRLEAAFDGLVFEVVGE